MDEHYYSENPQSEIKEKFFTQTICGVSLSFTAVSGVFSFETKIDKASEILIKSFNPSGKSVLDVGCGFGPIGLFIKAMHPDQTVYMCDINNRAVQYAISNAQKNNLNVNVIKSDLYSDISTSFDDIVSNPPIATGKKLNTKLINEAFDHLHPNGALWLVAFHNKGGSSLKKIMESRFGNVEDIEKSGGIRVYRSIKNA